MVSCVDNDNNLMHVSNDEYHAILGSKKRARKRSASLLAAGLLKINNGTEMPDFQSSKTASFSKFEKHVRYELEHMHALLAFFNQDVQKQMTFDAYRLKNRALDRVCQMITLGDKNTFVAFGGAAISNSSAGSQPSPGGALKKRLLQHTKNVSEVKEFMTSQMCPGCDSEIPMVAPVHCATFSIMEKRERKHKEKKTESKRKNRPKAPLTMAEKRAISDLWLTRARTRWKQPRGTRTRTFQTRIEGFVENAETWKHLPNWPVRADQITKMSKPPGVTQCRAKVQKNRYSPEVWSELRKQHQGEEEEGESNEKKEKVWFQKLAIRAARCCKQCKRVWNRDTAAAINILALYKELVFSNSRPPRFKPKPKKQTNH